MASSPRVKFAAAAVVRGIPLRNWYKATFFCIYSVNWTLQINKNPTTQKTNQNPKIQQRKKAKKTKTKGGGIENQSENLSPASPLAAMSLWESRTMILSSLDLWTSMLWTAEESATTMANPLPTNPNTHSMIYEGMSFRFSLLIFLCVGVWELLIWFEFEEWSGVKH